MLDELIRPIAHQIWIIEGQPEGRALDHWLEARRLSSKMNVSQPWYDPSEFGNETEWLRRVLWQPQPYLN